MQSYLAPSLPINGFHPICQVLLPIYQLRRDGGLSWPNWLNCSAHKVDVCHAQIGHRSGKVCRPKTDVVTAELHSQRAAAAAMQLGENVRSFVSDCLTERQCPEGMVWTECMFSCGSTCESLSGTREAGSCYLTAADCLPGCQCPEGTVWDRAAGATGLCVAPTDCNCRYKGEVYSAQSVIIVECNEWSVSAQLRTVYCGGRLYKDFLFFGRKIKENKNTRHFRPKTTNKKK